jgi:SAM-dependent methyltransferase
MKQAVFDSVAGFYDHEQEDFTKDIPFYTDYAKECGGEVLEIACGTGRVLIPIAKKGIKITGLDISQKMLDIARNKAAGFEKNIKDGICLMQADMKDFNIDNRFSMIYIAFRSFQSLITRSDQGKCLACVNKHLIQDGIFILDLFAPRHDILAQQKRSFYLGNFYDPEQDADIMRRCEDEYDLAKQTLKEDRFYEWTDKQGKFQRKIWSFELSYLFRFEAELLLEKYGFKIDNVYGDFDRSPYDYYSGEQIFVARKLS